MADWWEWCDFPEFLSAEGRRTAEALMERIGATWGDEEDEAGADSMVVFDLLVEESDLADLWAGVEHLHHTLDRALAQKSAPVGEVEAARRSLNRATRELWEADVRSEVRAYRQLLRDISHDIRSPLNSILFLVDGLYSGQAGQFTQAQRRQLGVVYSASSSLLNLVNDLLDFARTAEGQLSEVAAVPFSVPGVVADARRMVWPLARHQEVELETEVEDCGARHGDPQVLSRIFINLLSNAVEATGKGGTARLRVRQEGEGGEDLLVVVEDDGPQPDLERVRCFVGVEDDCDLTRMLQGQTHGLGLVICSRLVRAAGGEMDVDRTDGFTRFRLRFPWPPA